MTPKEAKAQLAAYVQAHPDQTLKHIAKKAGISVWTLIRVCKAHGVSRLSHVSETTLTRLDNPEND
jgi:DNA-binding MurR/RpiR family transcriptional regulator